jgi:hypothetical protein
LGRWRARHGARISVYGAREREMLRASVCGATENARSSVCPAYPVGTRGSSRDSHVGRLAIWRSRGILVVSATRVTLEPEVASVEPRGRGGRRGEDGSYTSPRSELAPSPRPWSSTLVVRVQQRTGCFPQVAWKPRALLLGSVGALRTIEQSPSRRSQGAQEVRRLRFSTFTSSRGHDPAARVLRGGAACGPGSMLSSLAPWRATPSPLPSPPGIHEASRGDGDWPWDFLRSLRTVRWRLCASP